MKAKGQKQSPFVGKRVPLVEDGVSILYPRYYGPDNRGRRQVWMELDEQKDAANGQQRNGIPSKSSKRRRKEKKRKAAKAMGEGEQASTSSHGEGEKRQKMDSQTQGVDLIGGKRDASKVGSGAGNASEAREIRKVMGIIPSEEEMKDDANDNMCNKIKSSSEFSFGFVMDTPEIQATTLPDETHDQPENLEGNDKVSGENGTVDSGTQRCVYVGGMPFALSEEEIKAFWSECGEVEKVQCLVFPDTKKFRGIAFITFASDEGYQKALSCNGEFVDGFELKVKPWTSLATRSLDNHNGQKGSKTSSLGEKSEGYNVAFVCNLPFDMSADSIKSLFADIGADFVRLHTKEGTSESRGFAHVHFSNAELLERAVAQDGMMVKGRTVRIGFAKPRDQDRMESERRERSQLTVDLSRTSDAAEIANVGVKNPQIHAVHISNLPFLAKSSDIEHLFSGSTITRIYLPLKTDGANNLGVGVVEFEDPTSCEKAIKINGVFFGGRPLALRYAKRRDMSKFRILTSKCGRQDIRNGSKGKKVETKSRSSTEKDSLDNTDLEDDPLMALL